MDSASYPLSDQDIQRAAAYYVRRAGYSPDDERLEDLRQIGYLAMSRVVDKYPDVSPGELVALARRSVSNAMCDCRRQLAQEAAFYCPQSDEQWLEPEDEGYLAQDERVFRQEIRVLIDEWVQSLPVRLREVFQAIYVDGLSQRATAQRLGISQPRVAKLNTRIRQAGMAALAGLRSG